MTLSRRRFVRTFVDSGLAVVMGAAALIASPAVLQAQDGSATAFPTAIGDSARDLVFTPVPRCRVIDTRVEGGRLAAGVPRHFDVAGTLAGQGGASDCRVPFGPATVVVLNLVAVQPLGAGTLTAWPFGGTMPTANVISFNARRAARAGINEANEVSLAICDPALSSCTYDLTLLANSGDTHLVADVAGYFSGVTGLTVPWTAVTGKPAGFDDGIDDDTRYSAGTGLTQSGTVFSVNPLVVQNRVSQFCTTGSSIRVINPDGTVICQTDTGTTYTGGAGINVSGSTISVPNLGIASSMLAWGAVTAGKIAANAVAAGEIVDRSINTAEIALGAVTGAELSSFAVTANKIAAGVVGAAEIATDAVGAAEIAAGAVGRSEIDGSERAIYRMRAACHADGITTSATCTTPVCSPFPVFIFWSCGNNCDSFAPLECDNTLLGYLLGPTIE
jgi:hypothetical protein